MKALHGTDWDADLTTAASARAVLPVIAGDLFLAGRQVSGEKVDVKRIHDFRLQVKRFRYTLELFLPVYGPGLDERLKSLRKLQQTLGKISDCTATLALLRATARAHKRKKKELAPLLSYIHEQERDRITEFVEYWRSVFDAPGEEERWVRYLRDYAGRCGRRPVRKNKAASRKSL